MKTQGFTLLELLFCMALIGIVLSLGAWTFRVFQGFQYRYIEQVDRTYNFIQLQDRLQKDFGEAAYMEALNPTCFLLLDQKERKPVRYCMQEAFITRNFQGQIDSFQFTGNWQLSNKGLSLQEDETQLNFSFQLPPLSQAKVSPNRSNYYERN